MRTVRHTLMATCNQRLCREQWRPDPGPTRRVVVTMGLEDGEHECVQLNRECWFGGAGQRSSAFGPQGPGVGHVVST